jgi:two-component system cell cycle response regulator CpdR
LQLPIVILLAEDDPSFQSILKEALEDGGYTVHCTSTGGEAIHAVWHTDQPLSGLVTEVQLGTGPNGWDLARAARERTADLPVVYLTGEEAHEWTAQGVPNSIMLQKPVANAQVVTAISSLLNEAASTVPIHQAS